MALLQRVLCCHLLAIIVGGVVGEPRYSIVFDAGSSGTRLNLYKIKFSEAVWLDWSVKVEPGVSSLKLSNELPKAKARLEKMLHDVQVAAPDLQRWKTPVQYLATAGIRSLTDQDQEITMDTIIGILKSSGFLFRDGWARTISGKEEGAFAWVAINYQMGNFDKTTDSKDVQTVGVLEMGGGSLQFVFEADASDNGDVALEDEYEFGKYRLYSHSYMNYGQNYAFKNATQDVKDNIANFCRHGENRSHDDFARCKNEITNNILHRNDAPGKYDVKLKPMYKVFAGAGTFLRTPRTAKLNLPYEMQIKQLPEKLEEGCKTETNLCDGFGLSCCQALLYQASVLDVWMQTDLKDTDDAKISFKVEDSSWSLGAALVLDKRLITLTYSDNVGNTNANVAVQDDDNYDAVSTALRTDAGKGIAPYEIQILWTDKFTPDVKSGKSGWPTPLSSLLHKFVVKYKTFKYNRENQATGDVTTYKGSLAQIDDGTSMQYINALERAEKCTIQSITHIGQTYTKNDDSVIASPTVIRVTWAPSIQWSPDVTLVKYRYDDAEYGSPLSSSANGGVTCKIGEDLPTTKVACTTTAYALTGLSLDPSSKTHDVEFFLAGFSNPVTQPVGAVNWYVKFISKVNVELNIDEIDVKPAFPTMGKGVLAIQVEKPAKEAKPDYYQMLGVSRYATQNQIKTAFGILIRKLHPDRYTVDTKGSFILEMDKIDDEPPLLLLRDIVSALAGLTSMDRVTITSQNARRLADEALRRLASIKFTFDYIITAPASRSSVIADKLTSITLADFQKVVPTDKFDRNKIKGLQFPRPEVTGSLGMVEKFVAVTAAYAVLSDKEERRKYDDDEGSKWVHLKALTNVEEKLKIDWLKKGQENEVSACVSRSGTFRRLGESCSDSEKRSTGRKYGWTVWTIGVSSMMIIAAVAIFMWWRKTRKTTTTTYADETTYADDLPMELPEKKAVDDFGRGSLRVM